MIRRREKLLHKPLAYSGPLYLYLSADAFAETWLAGGQVPLFGAATYLGPRGGIMTPDEVRQRMHTGSSFSDAEAGGIFLGNNLLSAEIDIAYVNMGPGRERGLVKGHFSDFAEDARILCLACSLDADLMRRLGKVAALEVINLPLLKSAFDEQVGAASFAGRVRYTNGEQRGHFLKSTKDEWQKEYRLVWPGEAKAPITVNVPAAVVERREF